MIEETGIKPTVGRLLYIQQFKHKDWEHLEFFFDITNSDDYAHVNLDATTHGALEIAEIGFIDPKTEHILPTFLTTQNLVIDAEAGLEKIFDSL